MSMWHAYTNTSGSAHFTLSMEAGYADSRPPKRYSSLRWRIWHCSATFVVSGSAIAIFNGFRRLLCHAAGSVMYVSGSMSTQTFRDYTLYEMPYFWYFAFHVKCWRPFIIRIAPLMLYFSPDGKPYFICHDDQDSRPGRSAMLLTA